jgi:hypothetical protein
MPPAKSLHRRHDRLQPVEVGDRGADHRHQLAPLLGHVALEQRPQRWIEHEQPIIEHRRRLRGDGHDLGERVTHEGLVFRGHGCLRLSD